MSVGENIRRIREERSISLERFSELTGISMVNCQGIEAGSRALTSSEVRSICQVLDVSFDVLVTTPQSGGEREEGSLVMPVDELKNLLGKMRE